MTNVVIQVVVFDLLVLPINIHALVVILDENTGYHMVPVAHDSHVCLMVV